ncbi:beta-lactamase family protein [Akkermansia glycaniphila]|uniref:serine hydrolase domain-containing protein n=1 Tax=Akkermansia glycaniphila TaxID=1679444 RepID=UPI001C0195B5|nr:serine hydrolase domain-containing protein [Akkermansia glycaniphila]MBT9449782.1 beta-lactamase family protein [Akkermansia glycaniphila]
MDNRLQARLGAAFDRNFREHGEIGASVSVWQHGKPLLELHGGLADKKTAAPWTASTLIPIYSATKCASAAALLLALHRRGLTADLQAGELWPRFPAPQLTIAQILSHQAGLAALSRQANIFDLDDCIDAIEHTRPAWRPPAHGYHPHTFGPILDGLMRSLTGTRIGPWWEENIRRPLGLDLYIGLPESEHHRVGTLYPGKAAGLDLDTPFYRQYLTSGTPIYRAFHSLSGIDSVRAMNTPVAWASASPASGGIATATGLARFYQILLRHDAPHLFPPSVLHDLATIRTQGDDLTLLTPTAFSCGAMLDPADPATGRPLRRLFGGTGFGHAGAGGSHAFALPSSGLSFAYTMNQMELSVLPSRKTLELVTVIFSPIQH